MERRLTAILAADVADYSRHTERNEEASTAKLSVYRAVVEESIAAHKGHIFTRAGDGVVAEFPSVVEAIRCAIEIQNEIGVRNASVPETERMQFRIGVNLGDVISEDNNWYGTGVNVAARLEQLAEPGGICISQTVYDQVRKIVEIPFQDIGEHRLKNIADPVHVYRVLPTPLPWYHRLLSHSKVRLRRPEFAALIFLLILAVAGGASYYLRQPAVFWSTLLSDSTKRAAIAVLPFRNLGGNDDAFSDGLTEDIMTGIARSNRDLPVLARATAFKYRGKEIDVRDLGRELGVRYVLEGSVKRSGDDVRVNANLADAQTGITIWSQQIDRKMTDIDFLVQDKIVGRIVAKIAGGYGVIEATEVRSARRKSPEQLAAYDLFQRAHAIMQWDWTPENFGAARAALKEAIAKDPSDPKARREWAWFSVLGWVFGVDYPPVPQKEIITQAIKAVQLDPADARAHMVAAFAYFFTKQLDLFEYEAEQALTLAPYDAEIQAMLGALIANMGQWQRGVALVEKANALNSDAAQGWYHSTMYLNDYLNGDYKSALDLIRQNPDFQSGVKYAYMDYIAICGQTGSKKDALEKPEVRCSDDTEVAAPSADTAWRKVLKDDPGASAQTFEDWYRMWNFRGEDIAKLMDGVYKSGVAKVQPVQAQDHHTGAGAER
jgi:class 3 adenylate cyclase/TolB-like protein/tetratricopeptide (TPR) repeat protein